MVLADHHARDRYVARQWMAVSDWLRAHPDSPDATEIRELHERFGRAHDLYPTILRLGRVRSAAAVVAVIYAWVSPWLHPRVGWRPRITDRAVGGWD